MNMCMIIVNLILREAYSYYVLINRMFIIKMFLTFQNKLNTELKLKCRNCIIVIVDILKMGNFKQ